MPRHFLIRGDQVVTVIDSDITDTIALPLLGCGDAMSLMCEGHALNLMANLNMTAPEALAALGLADLRAGVLSTVVIASQAAVNGAYVTGLAAYHLADISATYSLWQVCGQQDDLLRLHAQFWALAPTECLGLLAVVQSYGVTFYDVAVRTAAGLTVTQATERRDYVADYMESLGYTDTATLRAATTEHAQMVGITEALGYTEAQLWAAMADPA